jgi:CDP-diacylglycerol---glycerol-3-phosphate 3-phosphatidyltransferase
VDEAIVSKLLSREGVARVTTPLARVFLRAGFTADGVTIVGTAGSVLAALTLFATGRLFAGTFVICFFVMFDMLDGAVARESGGGSRFGAVLDATCDRISDGAVFCGLAWWAAFGMDSPALVVATMISLVTSQVISYIKARAEASGLQGDGGFIERPERFIIVLVGAGLSDLPVFPLPWALHVAMWLLAVASVITCAQRLHTVRHSFGAADPMPPAGNGRGPGESGKSEP